MEKELLDGDDIFVIHGFLSGEECDDLIARSEALGYEAATVGDVLLTQMRNNARVILDDLGLASTLWDRARPFIADFRGREINQSLLVSEALIPRRFSRFCSRIFD